MICFLSCPCPSCTVLPCPVLLCLVLLLLCWHNRNINLVRHSTPEGEGDQSDSSSSGSSSRVCNNLQLQLLSVARVHEAMAEGLAGGEGEGEGRRGGLLGAQGWLAAACVAGSALSGAGALGDGWKCFWQACPEVRDKGFACAHH